MAELLALQGRWQFEVTTCDIDTDPALRERYNTRVPVLTAGDQELCHYFLDPDKLAAYFEST